MATGYNFFFIRSASPKDFIFQIPIPPPVIEVNSGTNSETVNIVNLGEVNILKGRQLKSVSFESSLPRYARSSAVTTRGEFRPPEDYIGLFEHAQATNTPLVFAVTGLGLNIKVNVESFEYVYDTDYVNYNLSLKEYRDFKAKEVVLVTVPTTPTPATPTTPPKTTTTTTSVQTTASTRTKTDFAVGDKVICSGSYYADSYGGGSKGTFKTGFVGKISMIVAKPASGQTFPIHIVSESGSHSTSQRITWIGWVKKDQLKHV